MITPWGDHWSHSYGVFTTKHNVSNSQTEAYIKIGNGYVNVWSSHKVIIEVTAMNWPQNTMYPIGKLKHTLR